MLNLIGLTLSVLGLGVSLWQYIVSDRKHKRELDSLKEENTGAIQLWRSRTFLFGSLALFLLALLLVASRKTA